MNRTGLMIALAIATIVGLTFGIYPQLDPRIAAPFQDIVISGNKFGLRIYPPVMLARDTGLWTITALVSAVVLVLVTKVILPRRRMLISARAIVFLLTTLVLAPGILVNVTLKDNWSRPRPIDVTQFGGDEHFKAWWDPRGDCSKNCSFVSGDVSGAFWTLAPAALVPPQLRAFAYGGALAFGTAMSVLRIISGGHFFTDVVFAGVFTFLIIWLMYALIYRWKHTRLFDDVIERAIERFSQRGYDFVMSLFGGKNRKEKPH